MVNKQTQLQQPELLKQMNLTVRLAQVLQRKVQGEPNSTHHLLPAWHLAHWHKESHVNAKLSGARNSPALEITGEMRRIGPENWGTLGKKKCTVTVSSWLEQLHSPDKGANGVVLAAAQSGNWSPLFAFWKGERIGEPSRMVPCLCVCSPRRCTVTQVDWLDMELNCIWTDDWPATTEPSLCPQSTWSWLCVYWHG